MGETERRKNDRRLRGRARERKKHPSFTYWLTSPISAPQQLGLGHAREAEDRNTVQVSHTGGRALRTCDIILALPSALARRWFRSLE